VKRAISRRQILSASFALSMSFALGSRTVFAEDYPNRPIHLLVGGAAGSVPDTLARVIADRLSSALGRPVVTEDRPGAAGAIAISGLLAAPRDGYTLALATMSQVVFNRYLFSKLSYDPRRDLEPVALLASGALAIAVNPAFPGNSVSELIALAKAKPGEILVGTAGIGSPPNVFAHLLALAAGIDVSFVPYVSGPDGITGVIRGDVQIFVDAPTIIAPQVKAGSLKALAVTGRSREEQLPGVPTIAEAGLPTAQAEAWIGLVAASGTPSSVIAHLNRELTAILADPEVRQRLAVISFTPMRRSPADFRKLIEDDDARWRPVIEQAGIHLD
jgi:tripartite-type tricarboxylate transporter receptor subunit TctC